TGCVRLEARSQAGAGFAVGCKRSDEIAEQWCRPGVCCGLVADAGSRVAGADGALQRGQLLARESAEQQLDEFGDEECALGERVAAAVRGEVERVEGDRVVARE